MNPESEPVSRNPSVTTSTTAWWETPADVAVVGIASSGDELVGEAVQALGLEAAPGSTVRFPSPDGVAAEVVVAVRIGAERTAEALHVAAIAGLREARNARTVVLSFGSLDEVQIRAVAEAVCLAGYRFDRFRSTPPPAPTEAVVLCTGAAAIPEAAMPVARARTAADGVRQAKDWVNAPPQALTPELFAAEIAAQAPDGVDVEIWDEERLLAEGCAGTLAAGAGSVHPPRMVRLDYQPTDAAGHLVLVGKGVTFDSGGLSLKDMPAMKHMKFDMAGAAAVVAAVAVIARLEVPIRVTVFAPLAENPPQWLRDSTRRRRPVPQWQDR